MSHWEEAIGKTQDMSRGLLPTPLGLPLDPTKGSWMMCQGRWKSGLLCLGEWMDEWIANSSININSTTAAMAADEWDFFYLLFGVKPDGLVIFGPFLVVRGRNQV